MSGQTGSQRGGVVYIGDEQGQRLFLARGGSGVVGEDRGPGDMVGGPRGETRYVFWLEIEVFGTQWLE